MKVGDMVRLNLNPYEYIPGVIVEECGQAQSGRVRYAYEI